MKNKFVVVLVFSLLMTAVLGCSSINPFADKGGSGTSSNKSLTDKGVDIAVGEEKIGIPECDEVVDMLNAEMNDPNDNFVVKAGKAMFLNKIKQAIKESVEKNKNDTVEMTKNCKEFKRELVKYKAEEEKKKAQ